jgi:hypothetical protein
MFERCQLCKVNKRVNDAREKGDPSCCKWFLDNVICGDEYDADNCPDFEPLEVDR